MRGILLAFEGLDRTGKTTQVFKTKHFLESAFNRKVAVFKFPDRTTAIGKQINSFLQNQIEYEKELIHLLFSINRWELNKEIHGKLNEGYDVLLDRYAYSGVAYSHAQGLDFDWCISPDKGLAKPDKVLYFKPSDITDISKRAEYGSERYEREEFQRKVAGVYEQKLMKKDWLIVNANKTIDEVFGDIQAELRPIIQGFKGGDVQSLDFK